MACLHLSMAVGAEQNAFPSLLARLRETAGGPLSRQRECLPVRIDVMELQGGDTAVVSAHTAATARLGNENPLDLPPALRHALLRTTLAAVGAPGVEPETGRTVSQAVLLYLSGCVIGQGWLAPAVVPLDLPAPQPVSNRRNRSIEPLGNLLQACPVAHEPFEKLSIRSPTRCESFGSRRSEPVLPCPVGDGRRVHAQFPANLFQGLASFELSCQPFPIHEHMFAVRPDEPGWS